MCPDSRPAEDRGDDYRVQEARKAHERGWALTRLRGKRPIQKGWSKAPKPRRSTVERWALQGNVGLRTGSVSGIVVIDDDTDDGIGVAAFKLPKTVTVITGSGKRHYYYNYVAGLRNSVSKLADGVDIRADGGQVVFVGSVHPTTGEQYRWAPGRSPKDVPVAELPANVLQQLQHEDAEASHAPGAEEDASAQGSDEALRRYADGARRRAVEAVALAPEGQRNEVLNKQAFLLGRFVGAGLLDRDVCEKELGAGAAGAGLGEEEIKATLKSGLDAGTEDPHDRGELQGRLRSSGSASQSSRRPEIWIEGGRLPSMVDKAEAALLGDGGDQVYQRGTILVRIARTKAPTIRSGFSRAAGALVIWMVEVPYLVERLTRAAVWKIFDPSSGGARIVDCPTKVARVLLARAGYWRTPHLLGVIEGPTLRPDGSVLSEPGYDPITELYLDTQGTKFALIPDEPSRDDALSALGKLQEMVKGFPWVGASDRSTALAAMLTGLIRRSLRTAPLFAFRAPKMGSGKSLLADVVAMLGTGRVASVMSQGKDEDEDKKRMLAILMEGEPVACIDNVEHPLGGAAICSVLTQQVWKDRILGRTGTATVPTTTTWMATGNNMVFCGDISTRVLVCDLDPKCERPEERKFDVNLYSYVPEHRGELASAGLTVLRAYHVAGRPDQNLSVFGRFEEWSDWVRSALVWCGESDPCEGRRRIEDTDPIRRQLRAMLLNWHEEFGTRAVTAAEVIDHAAPEPDAKEGFLWQALVEVSSGRGGKPDPRRLGNWLAANERRVEQDMRFERAGQRQGVVLWQVTRG